MPPLITERLKVAVCDYCGREFYASRTTAKYCSKVCQQAFWWGKRVEQRDRHQ